jgi:hypothetical protein
LFCCSSALRLPVKNWAKSICFVTTGIYCGFTGLILSTKSGNRQRRLSGVVLNGLGGRVAHTHIIILILFVVITKEVKTFADLQVIQKSCFPSVLMNFHNILKKKLSINSQLFNFMP